MVPDEKRDSPLIPDEKGDSPLIQDEEITSYTGWMGNLPQHLTRIPMNKLAIPGSHNSGAYFLDPTTPMSPDKSRFIKTVGSCNKQIVINWSLCQSLTIIQQLTHGVRYFDMRPGFLDYEDDFFFVHGVHGVLIRDLLYQMRHFLDAYPREVIIVDFNHFHCFNERRHKRLAKMIEQIFDPLLVPRVAFNDVTFSLSDLWRINKQVVLSYKYQSVYGEHSAFWFSRHCLNSPWFNTNNLSLLKHRLDGLLQKPDDKKFNIYQAILSARKSTIALHSSSTLRQSLVTQCNQGIKDWLDYLYRNCIQGVNIVMCDFICEDGCVEKILRLNEIVQV